MHAPTKTAVTRDSSTPHVRAQPDEQSDDTGRTVLVLEFANISGDPDADWLSTGIAEAVSADLNKIAGLRVVGQDAAARNVMERLRQGRHIDGALATELAR